MKNKTISIPIDEIITAISEGSFFDIYSKTIANVLGANKNFFNEAYIKIEDFASLAFTDTSFSYNGKLPQNIDVVYEKKLHLNSIDISLIEKVTDEPQSQNQFVVRDNVYIRNIEHHIKYILVDSILFSKIPSVFISSVERTGVSIFQSELDEVRDNLIDRAILSDSEKIKKSVTIYPAPVKENISTIRTLTNIHNKESDLKRESPYILEYFSTIVSGNYKTVKELTHYIPLDIDKSLSLIESSSCVRSLLDLHIYLEHKAKKGQMLIIDEPELNLHPSNQRKIARLIAMLVNYGIKVFITTHSDFIIKELGILLLLGNDRNKKYIEQKGYKKTQILKSDMVNVYSSRVTQEKAIELCKENVSDEVGIELTSFDDSINEINELYSFLL